MSEPRVARTSGRVGQPQFDGGPIRAGPRASIEGKREYVNRQYGQCEVRSCGASHRDNDIDEPQVPLSCWMQERSSCITSNWEHALGRNIFYIIGVIVVIFVVLRVLGLV
jgi:hypothetical protein